MTATLNRLGTGANQTKCVHRPPCPPADASDRGAAHAVASHPQQGWTLLCNGVIVFGDTGELLPDGGIVPPHRGPVPHRPQG
jgi:hypothetical protein